MILTKKKIIIFLAIIILFLVISICIYFIGESKKNNKDNFANVTSTNYSYLGCYKDYTPKAIPNLVGTATPDQCYNMAKPNYDIFGLQNNQCFLGNSGDTIQYDKYGIQNDTAKCANIFGGDLTNQVYQVNQSPTTNTSVLYKNINVDDFWTVPEGVTQATFTVIGGCGNSNNNQNVAGNGAKVVALVNLIPGDVYNISVGGNANGSIGGKNNNGYNGSNGTQGGGGGGAATCVFNNSTPIIIAGGGGGCPNITNLQSGTSNIGGSGGINQNGDGGNGS